MPESIVQILQPDGTLRDGAELPPIPSQQQLRLYEVMLLNRRVDEQMIRLQRQGRIGFYIGSVGEEATVVGSACALQDDEWIVPCYRELGAALWRGYPLFDFCCQLFGNAQDAVKGRQMPNHYGLPNLRFTSISSPVGTQIPQALGMALGAKISGRSECVLVYFGDGATSQGDFHVAANFAGVYEAPLVLVCRNNQWAISVPLSQQTASESIAIKAQAYGIEGVRVDGNDVFAVLSVSQAAAEKARAGKGATLIESVTYRLTGHSTSDDPRAYRDPQEVESWEARDPLLRLRLFLESQGLIDEAKQAALEKKIKQMIQESIRSAEKIGPPEVSSLFEDVFDEMPPHLKEQQEELGRLTQNQIVEQEV